MDVTYTHCAGLDVHKKSVVACCITPEPNAGKQVEIRSFGTMTADLLALSDWLQAKHVTHVAMESTGEFWKPVYNLLEGNVQVLVVNARHIKNVPGRKTDVKDAEWIADLLRHGLLRGSFIPPQDQRDLRDLTRQRTNLVQDRATVVNRLQKVCEWANIKLSSVATDVTGVSGRAMLEAIVAGRVDAQTMAELAKGRMRSKLAELERALTGVVRDHHRFMMAQHLAQIDFLDEQVSVFSAEIAARMTDMDESTDQAEGTRQPPDVCANTQAQGTAPLTHAEAVALLDTIPGVNRRLAELLIAEIGRDMTRFPSAAHLASWAKVSPGNNESAGKHYSGATGHGNVWLCTALVQAAWAAVKSKTSYLSSFYYRLAGRRGARRAIVAVAHRILTAIYYMFTKREPFHDLGAGYLDEKRQASLMRHTERRFAQLGYRVIFQPVAPTTVQQTVTAAP